MRRSKREGTNYIRLANTHRAPFLSGVQLHQLFFDFLIFLELRFFGVGKAKKKKKTDRISLELCADVRSQCGL